MTPTTSIPTLTVQREIDASPEELFDAWLDPESLAIWMRPGNTSGVLVRVDPKVGGEFEIVMQDPCGAGAFVHTGRYLVIERPHVLAFTWVSAATHQMETLVTVKFHRKGEKTNLVLTHEKLPDQAAVIQHEMGWSRIIELLGETRGAA